MARYLKKWICEQGHENWAYEYKCSTCGGPKTKQCKRFLPDPPVEATDEQWKLKGPGPNWYCNWCDCENPVYNKENCGYCGGPIGEAETNVGKTGGLQDFARTAETAKEYETVKVDHGEAGWGIPEEFRDDKPEKASFTPVSNPVPTTTFNRPSWTGSSGVNNTLTIVGIAAGLLVLCLIGYAIWYNFLDTDTKGAQVSGYSWSQTLILEEYQTLSRTDWASDMPSDAYNESCTNTFKEWTKEPDGTEEVDVPGTCSREENKLVCKDDGADGVTCEDEKVDVLYSCTVKETRTKYKDVQVYEDKCSYNIDRWVEVDRFPTSGNDHNPFYFNYPITNPSQYRTTEVPGTYTVYFTSDAVDAFQRNYDLATWRQFNDEPGQYCSIEVNRQNQVVGWPQPAIAP